MYLPPEFVEDIHNSFGLDGFPVVGEDDYRRKLIDAIRVNYARQGRVANVRIKGWKIYAESEEVDELEGAKHLETLYCDGFFDEEDSVLHFLAEQMADGSDAMSLLVHILSRIDRLEAIVATLLAFDYTSWTNRFAQVGIGAFIYQAGEYDKGLEALKYACTRYPTDAAANRCLGFALLDQGELEQAIDAMRRGLLSDPNDHEAMLYLAGTLTELDDPQLDEADHLCATLIRDTNRDSLIEGAIELRRRIADYRAVPPSFFRSDD